MSSSALGLNDLVAAMPAATTVIDRWGRCVCSNDAWRPLADEVDYLFSADPSQVPPAAAIRDVIDGVEPSCTLTVQLTDDPETESARAVTLRVAPIGEQGEYFMASCEPLDTETVEPSVLVDRNTVTGLPGTKLFCELLAQSMTMSSRHAFKPVVLAVAVDGLESIEEFHGTSARRELFVAMASRFKSGLRPSDVVAQPAPERFLVLLPDVDGIDTAEHIAHRLCVEMSHPFRVDDRRVRASVRVGIASSDVSAHPEYIIAAANEALKDTTPIAHPELLNVAEQIDELNLVSVAAADRRPERTRNTSRRIDLREMKDEELISYFQPIFDVRDNRVVAGEALMRWRHPHYGVLSAGEFLGLAINSGMLATLTDQALVRATETWADLRDQLGPRPPRLFVNLSPEQLLSRVAVERLYHLLIATGLPSSDVVVEVTEEAMATRFGEMIAVLSELRDQGLHVALDDFGSGYSSLGRLRHLPVDVIKVDQTMVRGLETDRRAQQLLAAVATMANELDVDCIVEGIETAGEAQIVADLGFRYVQGYHFARPMPADEFVCLVNRTSGALLPGTR